ncbi:MAG: thioredoxin [Candidatus Omnitrophica bacterium]|nr:thioredoxin [Candidatus Omnitrophota bacterium]MCM8828139.1 thioredoxin [Candidatus Omnitrophota bacterium]
MKVLNSENFDAVIGESPLVFVDFYADWCGPCRMMAPVVEEIAKELEGKVVVAKLNVDENPEIAARFQIFSIPTFILFKDGKPRDKIIGAAGKAGLLEKIKGQLTE